MNTEKFFELFREEVNSRPEEFRRDHERVKEEVKNSSARYMGQTIDFLFQPMFLSSEDINWLEGVISRLTDILDKTVEKYRTDQRFREVFPFSKITEELILADPGYDNLYPMGRFDVFYDYDRGLQFCEFNTDGSAGMNEARVLQKVFSASKAISCLSVDYQVSYYAPMKNWIDVILENYREFSGGPEEPEKIAIVDFEEEGIASEFREFKRLFEKRGYNTVIRDPRELKYDGSNLLDGSDRIDLVYRRATTKKMVDRHEEIEDFLAAYKDESVCVVGGFTSQIVHNKALFAILQEEEYTGYLDDEEEKFVKEHFPLSRIFKNGDGELRNRLIEEQGKFLLKPFDKFAGHGVHVGDDFGPTEWKEKVAEVQGENYIAQEFCDVPEKDFLHVRDREMGFEKFGYLIGMFLYNQRLSGLYTRAGRENVIASLVECFTLPNFIVEEIN
ncbi:glutathionylspermidine synthase family protein [Candidatus Bipolaricaulota bacterium]|nr:glutathionylspermidine synthase family protein [Candidatus Bipolaricaulota bacterium]